MYLKNSLKQIGKKQDQSLHKYKHVYLLKENNRYLADKVILRYALIPEVRDFRVSIRKILIDLYLY